jgi:hypothetical protein
MDKDKEYKNLMEKHWSVESLLEELKAQCMNL